MGTPIAKARGRAIRPTLFAMPHGPEHGPIQGQCSSPADLKEGGYSAASQGGWLLCGCPSVLPMGVDAAVLLHDLGKLLRETMAFYDADIAGTPACKFKGAASFYRHSTIIQWFVFSQGHSSDIYYEFLITKRAFLRYILRILNY